MVRRNSDSWFFFWESQIANSGVTFKQLLVLSIILFLSDINTYFVKQVTG